MAATALTDTQRQLLGQIAEGRVWRVGHRFQLVRPIGPWQDLEPGTIKALLLDGYITEVESHGVDRSLYEINAHGRAMLRTADTRQ